MTKSLEIIDQKAAPVSASQVTEIEAAINRMGALIGRVNGSTALDPSEYPALLADLDRVIEAGKSNAALVASQRRTATREEILNHLTGLLKSVPYDGGKGNAAFFGRQLIEDIVVRSPSVGALALACRDVRWKHRFLPTIADVIERIEANEAILASFDWKSAALRKARQVVQAKIEDAERFVARWSEKADHAI